VGSESESKKIGVNTYVKLNNDQKQQRFAVQGRVQVVSIQENSAMIERILHHLDAATGLST
jgi:hypothetical protein